MPGTSEGAARGVAEIIFDAPTIAGTVARLAEAVAADYAGRELLLVGVLKGAIFFAADLARALSAIPGGPSDIMLDFLAVSSYGNANRSSGEVRLVSDTAHSLEGRHVIIVEDIVDNGLTLSYLRRLLTSRAPASLAACVLLDKPWRRAVDVPIEYVGLTCPDEFVVGYGLDYAERYRTLPFLARLDPSVIAR